MCRIVSLFLLQRLKGSISGNARDFNNIKTRALIKFFFFLQGKAPKEIHAILTETLREHAPSWVSCVHHSWRFGHAEALREVGPEMPERGSKTSTVSVVLATFFRRDPNYFLSRSVTMDETWLYHYDPETKQQSLEWRHSGSPRPKNSECKNPLEKFSPQFFGIKAASSALIIFQRAELSTRCITHLCWCN